VISDAAIRDALLGAVDHADRAVYFNQMIPRYCTIIREAGFQAAGLAAALRRSIATREHHGRGPEGYGLI